MRTFVHFTIVVLTWYYFTSYSIVLPISISSRVFQALSIYCGCFINVTTKISDSGFGIIALCPYFTYSPVFFNYQDFTPFFVTNVR